MPTWRSLTKIPVSGSASWSICQRQGSADPDPHKNVNDPYHWRKPLKKCKNRFIFHNSTFCVVIGKLMRIRRRFRIQLITFMHFHDVCWKENNCTWSFSLTTTGPEEEEVCLWVAKNYMFQWTLGSLSAFISGWIYLGQAEEWGDQKWYRYSTSSIYKNMICILN